MSHWVLVGAMVTVLGGVGGCGEGTCKVLVDDGVGIVDGCGG